MNCGFVGFVISLRGLLSRLIEARILHVGSEDGPFRLSW